MDFPPWGVCLVSGVANLDTRKIVVPLLPVSIVQQIRRQPFAVEDHIQLLNL